MIFGLTRLTELFEGFSGPREPHQFTSCVDARDFSPSVSRQILLRKLENMLEGSSWLSLLKVTLAFWNLVALCAIGKWHECMVATPHLQAHHCFSLAVHGW